MTQRSDVRASYLAFPRWTQHFWTWFTGKALPGQQPLIRHTWYSYLGTTLAAFFGGLAISILAVALRPSYWLAWLLLGWVASLAGARMMILIITHQCIHRQFSGRPGLDTFWGEAVTVLNAYQDAHAFKVEHFDAHHREGVFATFDDPPVQVILGLGFKPGMSRRQLWLRACSVFLSPTFYLRGFANRLHSNLTSGSWRRAGFAAWAGWWLSLPFWMPHGGQVLVLAFVVPIVLLNQLSALLDKLGEHAWLTPPHAAHGAHYYHVSASWARFCGSPVPAADLSGMRRLNAWARWVSAMLLYHLPSRLLVVVGDLPNHDFHHRCPRHPTWTTAAYARQRDIDNASPGSPDYVEVWGMGRAIDKMFRALSQASPSPERQQGAGPARRDKASES
jgi:hypothetical protein